MQLIHLKNNKQYQNCCQGMTVIIKSGDAGQPAVCSQ
jgi:hypothetical protein